VTIEDLKKLDIKELKAMAFDSIDAINREEMNIKVLRQVIAEKLQKAESKNEIH
jgi:hypothetical protein